MAFIGHHKNEILNYLNRPGANGQESFELTDGGAVLASIEVVALGKDILVKDGHATYESFSKAREQIRLRLGLSPYGDAYEMFRNARGESLRAIVNQYPSNFVESTLEGYWALICNPATWAIDEFLRDGKSEGTWGVDRHASKQIKHFRDGQLAVVRVVHDHRSEQQRKGFPPLQPGIYALCQVLSATYPGEGGRDKYSTAGEVHPKGWPTINVRYLKSFLDAPLLIEDMRRSAPDIDQRLLNNPRPSSLPLSASDFKTILSLLKARFAIGEAADEVEHDLQNIRQDKAVSETSRKALVDARCGQGQFRKDLQSRWRNRCAVTECSVNAILRASHMKPWREATNGERLDPANGLLLVAHLDALFDNELISFSESGEMLMSNLLSDSDRKLLGIPRPLRSRLSAQEKVFLAYHRNKFEHSER